MPILDLEEQEVQILVNAVAMANPLVRKIMEQLQAQQEQAASRAAPMPPPRATVRANNAADC